MDVSIEVTDLTLSTADGPMRAYSARPGGGVAARGAVVVIQEAFGVNDHIEDVTRRFATAGYHAVAPALFHRAGGGTASYDDFSKVLPLFEGMTDDGIVMDVDAAMAHLEGEGWAVGQIGLVGFCMGGRVSFLAAVRRQFGASVGFYGGGIVTSRIPLFSPIVGEVANLATPWLGLFGDLDKGIPVEDVEALRAALDEHAVVDHEIVRYPDADHGFHCDARASYHPSSAADAWTRALAWFDRHLA